jgi:5-methyltetrahydrofolate--homocysteine methyltransferase
MKMTQALIDAIADMREDEVFQIVDDLLEKATNPLDILDACREAMQIIGDRFQKGDCFIPELMLGGEMLGAVSARVKPLLQEQGAGAEKIGKVVFGTVQGDIHDIAKDIVVTMLDINGFDVTDLGIDVPPAKFVEAVKETGAKIVGLSGFLTLAFDPMKDTVQALKEAGLGDVKVMIGGGQIDEQIQKYTNADAYGRDAMAAVALAKQWA